MQAKEKFDSASYNLGITALEKKDYATARKYFNIVLPATDMDLKLNDNKSTSERLSNIAYNYGILCSQSFHIDKDASDLFTAKKLFQLSYKNAKKTSKKSRKSAWKIKQQLYIVLENLLNLNLESNTESAKKILDEMLVEYQSCFSDHPSLINTNEDKQFLFNTVSQIIDKVCDAADQAYDEQKDVIAITYYPSALDFLNFQKLHLTKASALKDIHELESKMADIQFNLSLIYERSSDKSSTKKYAESALKIYKELSEIYPENENYRNGIHLLNETLQDLLSNSKDETITAESESRPRKKRKKIAETENEINIANFMATMPSIIPLKDHSSSNSSTTSPEPVSPKTNITELTISNSNDLNSSDSFFKNLFHGNLNEQTLFEFDQPQLISIESKLSEEIEITKSALEESQQNIHNILNDILNKKFTKLTELYDKLIGYDVLTQKEKIELGQISKIVAEFRKDSSDFVKQTIAKLLPNLESELNKIDEHIFKLDEQVKQSESKRKKIVSISEKIGIHKTWKNNLDSTQELAQKLKEKYPIEEFSHLNSNSK